MLNLSKWFSASPVAVKVIAAPQEPMPRRVGDDFQFPDVKIKKGLADPHDFAAWLVNEGRGPARGDRAREGGCRVGQGPMD